jgi:predicted nucleic acid-binding protein
LGKVLVDTSVWIEFFRKKEPYYSIVSGLMEDDRVCSLGLILAELLQGAKSEKEIKVLKEFIYVFDFLPESAKNWELAGELSFGLSRKGTSAGLSDCYIAVTAKVNEAKLFTLDGHFQTIKRVFEVGLYTP